MRRGRGLFYNPKRERIAVLLAFARLDGPDNREDKLRQSRRNKDETGQETKWDGDE